MQSQFQLETAHHYKQQGFPKLDVKHSQLSTLLTTLNKLWHPRLHFQSCLLTSRQHRYRANSNKLKQYKINVSMHISDLLLCLSAFADTDLLFRISSTNAVAPLSCKVSIASFTAPVTPEQDNIYIHNVCVHKYLYIFSTETHSLSPSWPEQAWEWWWRHQKTGKKISNKAVRITVHTWGVLIESGESNVAQLLWSLSNPWNLTQPPCNWIQSHLLPSVHWELIY